MEVLIEEIDALYVEHVGPDSESKTLSTQEVQERLTGWSKALLASLPAFIQEQVGNAMQLFLEGIGRGNSRCNMSRTMCCVDVEVRWARKRSF